jgi:hypothetical protein
VLPVTTPGNSSWLTPEIEMLQQPHSRQEHRDRHGSKLRSNPRSPRDDHGAAASTRLAVSSLGGFRTPAPVRVAPPSWGRHPKTFTTTDIRPRRKRKNPGVQPFPGLPINRSARSMLHDQCLGAMMSTERSIHLYTAGAVA